jgi:inorganic pyrophosphatase
MKLPGAFTKDDIINVVIETPARSRNKYTYDPETEFFELRKVLPQGTAFPLSSLIASMPWTHSFHSDK